MPEPEVAAEADVVIVGGGPAGMSAAIEAARGGGSAIVVESLDRLGGNASISGGYINFLDSGPQRRDGIEDSEELFFADLKREVDQYVDEFGTIFDEELTRQYIQESTGAYHFLSELGIGMERFVTRPLQYSVPRTLVVDEPDQFRTAFTRAADELGIQVLLETTAERLALEDGRIVGLRVRRKDGRQEVIRARGGVVLASGSFPGSFEMRLRYQPERKARAPYLGVATCDGSGHLMGQSVGADLINMAYIQSIIIASSVFLEDCIGVNLDGVRFHDETGPVRSRAKKLEEQRDQAAFYIFDDRQARARPHLIEEMPGDHHTADTLDELAAVIGCPPEALTRTVADWNALVISGPEGKDPFGRSEFPSQLEGGIVEPPFHAAQAVMGILIPVGGFRVSPAMEVLDVYGEPIPRLYAAGDNVGGVLPAGAIGGVHLSSAVAFGRIAGLAAAGLKQE